MKYIILSALALALSSCGMNVSFGIKKNGLDATYSPKGGLAVTYSGK